MNVSDINITPKEYELISKLVYDRFGINLGGKKQSLVTNRLRKVLVENNFSTFKDYYQFILNDKSGNSMDTLINRISTNLTYFARENEHFDFLQKTVLPEQFNNPEIKRGKSIRLWCAGCSTGEEPYTLSMVMHESVGVNKEKWKLGILATDISAKALKIAEQGRYADGNVEKINSTFKSKYFQKQDQDSWTIKSKIKDIILFRRLNLMRTEFPFQQKFHSIFCRNVMIYFDVPTREELIKKFSQHMVDGGYLFIGHSESLGRSNEFFEYVKPAVYRKIK
ncbi:MAG: protein-glutamate O-methyltransferase CheR [Calditrichaeota bacterium]|nr:MAG: protein-glutamate O-methyltransferase CheR [Calditrichota bacterium]MBL1203981.1 protein-glutamate O-methyltransferase CheR [Calditrichota bacterium]NOG43812.1 protein-glutamate O-methyltransferase CheR [Calditrichota bacterium]